jgi:alkylated DNA repair protein alkB homolog 8
VQGPLDQLTVNDYPLGVGISPHIETHSAFDDTIAALSLGSSAVMIFRRSTSTSTSYNSNSEEGDEVGDGGVILEQKALLLPPRSLLIMKGEARLAWAHYIPHRRTDYLASGKDLPRGPRRVSFTYRKVREEPCECAYPALCDSQEGSIPPTRMAEKLAVAAAAEKQEDVDQEQELMNCNSAQSLEDSNVNNVYNAIAPHFSATRFAIWPAVRKFIENIPSGGIVADVGCGNGKYFGVRKDLFTAGSDRSIGLAKVAAQRLSPAGLAVSEHPRADVIVADGLELPYRESSCDAVLCIAVVHHMASVKRRISFLEGLLKILVPGGRGIVTVWATEQENMKKVSKWDPLMQTEDGEEGRNDYLVPWHLPMHRVEAVAAAQSAAEVAVDTGKNALVFRRYYHLFEPGELEGLVEQVPGAAVVEGFYDKDNWCVVFERKF